MTRYELHREAEGDLYAAAGFYEDHVPGLGLDFLSEFEDAMSKILERPLANPLWPDVSRQLGIRRKLLDRFPYGLPYLHIGERVIVLAVAHLSREPRYWLSRGREYFR
jgi:plasmid stabilization system protein ParE